jgi:hypothetical protein
MILPFCVFLRQYANINHHGKALWVGDYPWHIAGVRHAGPTTFCAAGPSL